MVFPALPAQSSGAKEVLGAVGPPELMLAVQP